MAVNPPVPPNCNVRSNLSVCVAGGKGPGVAAIAGRFSFRRRTEEFIYGDQWVGFAPDNTGFRGNSAKNKLDRPDAQPLQSPASFMNKNPFAGVLIGLLFICGAVIAAFAVIYTISSCDLRKIQPQVAEIQSRLNFAQALLNDTLEYSKRNPAIDPLLQSLNFKTNVLKAENANPKPAAK